MLVSQICRELRLGKIASKMQSRVPRCLFGPPNPKDTIEMLNEALDMERQRFSKRWGVDVTEEDDKENAAASSTVVRLIPVKKRASPYAKQTAIYDYWRVKKVGDSSKRPRDCSNDDTAFAEFNYQNSLRTSQLPVLQLSEQMQPLHMLCNTQQQHSQQQQEPQKSTTEPVAPQPLQTLSQNTVTVKTPPTNQ